MQKSTKTMARGKEGRHGLRVDNIRSKRDYVRSVIHCGLSACDSVCGEVV